ncbi:hypothetical protein J6590_100260 [Homalodisca vitripennis]|nr:hypothetical protein J6590_100260 [Homalodisca vitripennis]
MRHRFSLVAPYDTIEHFQYFGNRSTSVSEHHRSSLTLSVGKITNQLLEAIDSGHRLPTAAAADLVRPLKAKATSGSLALSLPFSKSPTSGRGLESVERNEICKTSDSYIIFWH